MDKEQVIELINKMRALNQSEQARATYKLANEAFPQWNLREAFEMKGKE